MAPPSLNDNMMSLLLQQCQETKALYSQQQTALDKLTEAVNGLVQKRPVVETSQINAYQSDYSDDQISNAYDVVSSDDDELSDTNSFKAPEVKKRKLDNVPLSVADNKLKKLKAVETQFSKQETYGASVHDVVATTVNKGLSEPINHKATVVEDLLKKYNRPENCPFLDVPKVNKLLWSNRHTGKELKQGDKVLQRAQNYLTKGMIPIIHIMNKTLEMESKEAGEIFDLSLDAFNLLAYSHRDFSTQRRRLLMPAIANRYAALGSESEKFSSPTQLFGDDKDLEKRLKDIDDSQRLSKNLTVMPSARPRLQANAGLRWGTKDRPHHRQAAPSSRDFLGKRALAYRPAYQHQRVGLKKGDQGQKKSQGIHKR